ncbi:MAG: protein kinase [Deltaproteobacteria bacterium]|nr:protein kinase [Deltaproteobacteria bacterium]
MDKPSAERPSAQRSRFSTERNRFATGGNQLPLPPGEIIPGTRYRIITRVGLGAMGAVYQAEHVDLEKRVALKTLLAASARDPEAVEHFRKEARAASKIGSPFICDVTDFGQLPDGEVFFVMEYIDGPSLRQVMEVDKQVAVDRAIAILRQTCKALGAAHDKGIIHLDVKPDNIMLTTSGRRGGMVKVVDFGIAGLIRAEAPPEGAAAEDRVVGTPDYLAPERIRGKGYDHRSDIYSLGAMAYEMLTGTCPFWHEDLLTTITKHVAEKPLPFRARAPELEIPSELENLVMQMLAKNPAERPQSMAVVEAMLCEAQIAGHIQTEWDDLPLPEVDEEWQKKLGERMPSPRSRRLRRIALVSGLVAAVGVAAALYFGLRRPKEIVAYTPVYVEVTKTDEADNVAPWLAKASMAAAAERFFEPAGDSALHYIEKAESEAKKVGTSSGGAALLRRLYGNQFRSLGNALMEAKLSDLAVVRFGQALRFLPGDADLRAKLGMAAAVGAGERGNEGSGAGAPAARKPLDEGAKAAADVFSAGVAGRFSQARAALGRLREHDAEGRHAARLADEFRKRAQALWDAGKHDEARPYYQLVAELDPKDTLSAERASGKEEEKAEPVAETAPPPEPAKIAKKRGGLGGEPAVDDRDDNAPRDRAASAKAAAEGASALARGDLAGARAAFDRAVRADASNPDAVVGLAEVAFENARYTEALDYGRRAARLQPRAAKHHMVVGDAYFKLLRYDEAKAAYARALALAPNSEGIKARIGRVNARLGP